MELNDKPISSWGRRLLGIAIHHLGKAVVECDETWRSVQEVENAIHNINQFIGEISPAPKLTEAEAELSSNLHTYLRKFEDGPLSSLLYTWISDDRAKTIWRSFIKELAIKYDIQQAINVAQINYEEAQSTENLVMYCALRLWAEKGLKRAIKEVRSWSE